MYHAWGQGVDDTGIILETLKSIDFNLMRRNPLIIPFDLMQFEGKKPSHWKESNIECELTSI